MKKTLFMLSFLAGAITAQAQYVLHNNGPLITHPGGGNAGANASALHNGLTTLGAGHALSAGNRVADNFNVPVGQTWNLDSLVFFAYQTLSTLNSTINSVNVRIWNGSPDQAGSSVIFGDTTTNRLASSKFSGIYRTGSDSDLTNTDRPIMRNSVTVSPGLALTAGTYWVDWQTGGTLTSGPWAPTITITNQLNTGDARQRLAAGAWINLLDVGTNTPQGLPFLVIGTVTGLVNDAAIAAITTPNNACVSPAPTGQVCINITNAGSATLSNIPVSYVVNNGTPVNETFAGPLAPGVTANYCFTTNANLATVGFYNITASTQLVGDELAANNSIQKSVTIAPNPNVTLTSLLANYCSNANNVTLNGSPAGGTYTGPSITGNSFSPIAAGVGTHTITYNYTNSAGCSGSVTRTVTINQAPVASFTHTSSGGTYNFTSTATGATTYSWNFGSGNTSTDPNPTFTFPATGGTFPVTLIVTAANGCTASFTQQILVDPLGVAQELDAAVTVFPNPSAGSFTVTLPTAAKSTVEVTNLHGQAICRTINEQADMLQVSLPEMAKGIYLVKVSYQGHSLIRKIVIN